MARLDDCKVFVVSSIEIEQNKVCAVYIIEREGPPIMLVKGHETESVIDKYEPRKPTCVLYCGPANHMRLSAYPGHPDTPVVGSLDPVCACDAINVGEKKRRGKNKRKRNE